MGHETFSPCDIVNGYAKPLFFFFFLSTKDSTIFIIGFKVNTPSGLIAKIKFKTNNNRRNPKGGGGVFPFYVDRKWACQGCRRQRSDPLECDSLGYQEYKTNSIFIRKHLWHFLPLHYQCIWKQQQIQKKKKNTRRIQWGLTRQPPHCFWFWDQNLMYLGMVQMTSSWN